jgi:enoyl-CoA hydratase
MSEVLVSREGEHVVVITLSRPEQRNALDLPTRKSLAGQFEALAQDDTCRAVVITGGPEVFAAGADLRMLAELDSAGAKSLNLARFWKPIADFPKPLIAAVNGLALGGGFELAMHADVIIAGRSAQFGLPEPRVGIMPGAGGTQRLVRAIGKFQAMHLLLSASPIDAERAYAIGIASELCDVDGTIHRAIEFAAGAAKLPPLAIRGIKRAVTDGADLPCARALASSRTRFRRSSIPPTRQRA